MKRQKLKARTMSLVVDAIRRKSLLIFTLTSPTIVVTWAVFGSVVRATDVTPRVAARGPHGAACPTPADVGRAARHLAPSLQLTSRFGRCRCRPANADSGRRPGHSAAFRGASAEGWQRALSIRTPSGDPHRRLNACAEHEQRVAEQLGREPSNYQ